MPTYDADGNMTSYNGWTYTWNGENRLVAAENSDTRLEFSYDYMGRRLEKKVYSKGLLTLYDWSLEKHRKFVYDGYKLIAEFEVEDDNATLFASYLWQPTGLDVPLMRIADNTQTYYIADGNKNIIALKDSSGADVSTYAYTPFGALENPVDGDENPFRFSSEYADDETGLVYYNYRYYSPQLGRWTKRDPIEEEGGVNLYVILANQVLIHFDQLGLKCVCGVDVTEAVTQLLENISTVMAKEFLNKSLAIKQRQWHNPGNGWDIHEFFAAGKKNSSKFNGKKCGQGPDCQNTVTLWGGCYKVWAVNYLLWGKLYSEAGLSLKPALAYVKSYRATKYLTGSDENEPIAKGTSGRLFFTEVGYKNIIPSTANVNNYTQCEPCKETYQGKLTARIKWYDNTFLEISNKSKKSQKIKYNIGF